MDIGLTRIDEEDIAKHRATAQSFVTRIIVMEDRPKSDTALAAPGGASFPPFRPAA